MEGTDRVWDGPATTAELESLKQASEIYSQEKIQAWSDELVSKYERHLARRRLLISELTCEVPPSLLSLI